MFWHVAEQCAVVADGRSVRVSCGDVMLTMTLPDELRCDVYRGVERPQPAGWISRRFDSKIPTTTVVASGRVAGSARLVTRFNLDFKA
jgi:hypothetical protein